MLIKKGDNVLVLRGKDKDKKGKVLRCFPPEGKVLVEKVNMKKMHKRARKQGEKGQIVEVAAPINVFKVKLICPKCGQPARIGHKFIGEKKSRICKKCGEEV